MYGNSTLDCKNSAFMLGSFAFMRGKRDLFVQKKFKMVIFFGWLENYL